MNTLRLAWRMLRRDARAGELHLLGLALFIAVASLTSVSFFSDRLARAMNREAHQMLGGDLLLHADHPWPAEFRAEAERRGLAVVDSLGFASMVSREGFSHLADIKAVAPGYPLRGALRIAAQRHQPDAQTREVPQSGSVWLDERLMTELQAEVGDRLTLGDARFTVSAVLTLEPDRGINFINIAPRLMMRVEDVAATGLLQVGSRVTYRLHLAGDQARVDAFQDWAKARLGRGEQIEDIDNARPEVRHALERAEKFLRLAALLAVVLAAVAIGLAARRFLERHLDGCAVMRCLGAQSSQLLKIYLGEFLIFGILVSALGGLAGYLAQSILESLLAGLITTGLPEPSAWPLLFGVALGLVVLAGFALPPLLRLRRVPTIRVLRREWSHGEPLAWGSHALGVAVLSGLVLWLANDRALGLWVLGLFLLAVLVYWLVARLAFFLLGRVRGAAGVSWRFGVAALLRRPQASLIQAVALGLGVTTLLLLALARNDLLASWQHSMPPDAPNRFVINIQPEQRAPLSRFFASRGLAEPELLPMVRARLVRINDRPVQAGDYEEERAQRLVEREFNLSWTNTLPEGNSIAEGQWFSGREPGADGFSVEAGLAETLGLKLGDRLSYEIAGRAVDGTITSLRKLDWDSMRVNFFVLTPENVLESFPTSYITSFHLAERQGGFISELAAAFPNLTVIDVVTLLRQLRSVMDQLAQAVQFVFAFSLLAGLAVLLAALEATHDEREFEMAVLRTLGARNRQLRAALTAEFVVLGVMVGAVAVVGSLIISALLARFVFHIPYDPGWSMVPIGMAGSVLGVTLAGLAGTIGLLRRPVLPALRAQN